MARQQKHTRRSLKFESCESRLLFAGLHGDFNGDGFDDLVVGVPHEDLGSVRDAGAVQVFYGSSDGVTTANDQVLRGRNSYDQFGAATAVGDFNNDGYDDLAVASPRAEVTVIVDGGRNRNPIGCIFGCPENIDKPKQIKDAGHVQIFYGSNRGLSSTAAATFSQGNLAGSPEANDQFGSSLTAGDFNGDGRDDLAIGVPYESYAGDYRAGVVHVVYGSHKGLTTSGNQLWHQDKLGGSSSERNDQFGTTLASGDFDRDGRDDLAIGSPFEDIGKTVDAGSVNVVYGSRTGLNTSGNQFWSQSTRGIKDKAESNDRFANALAVGDFNGDGRDDLAIGVPNENIGGIPDAGAVNVLYGRSSAGLSSYNDDFWHQDTYGVVGSAAPLEFFGNALAAGDFNADGRDDLAIGVMGETVRGHRFAGAVNVLFGSSNDLTSYRDQMWTQDSRGVYSAAEAWDYFGSALATGDYNGDGRADLAIGVSGEDIGSVSAAGAVNLLYGSRTDRLQGRGYRDWISQNTSGVWSSSELNDRFGDSF